MRFCALFTAALSALLASAPAAAQDQVWLKDRRYSEGIGIRTGNFELHPGAALEFGYDSNFFQRSAKESPVGALRLRLTPHFFFSTLGPQRRESAVAEPPPDIEFRGGLSLTYYEFFPVSGDDAGQELMKDQRNLGGILDLTVNIKPGQPWSGSIYGDIGRTITATNQGITSESFNRIGAHAGAELVWQPNSGLLDWRLGYRFSGTIFEADRFTGLTNLENTIQTRGRFRFLPRTALIYDARFGFITYPSATQKTSSHPLRMQLGFNGLITKSFGLLAMAGWGAGFYSAPADQNDFDSVIGQLEVRWYLTPNPSSDPDAATTTISAVTAGFLRDFQDSYLGSYFERDRGYLNFTYLLDGKYLLVLDGGVGPHVYPAIPQFNKSGFTALRADASLFGEYRIKDYFGLNLTLRLNANLTGESFTVPPGVPDYIGFGQFESYLGVRWFM